VRILWARKFVALVPVDAVGEPGYFGLFACFRDCSTERAPGCELFGEVSLGFFEVIFVPSFSFRVCTVAPEG